MSYHENISDKLDPSRAEVSHEGPMSLTAGNHESEWDETHIKNIMMANDNGLGAKSPSPSSGVVDDENISENKHVINHNNIG